MRPVGDPLEFVVTMSAKGKVYFTPVREQDDVRTVQEKLTRLLDASEVLGCIKNGDRVAVKIHFGEEKNTGHVKAEYAAVVCRRIIEQGGAPLLTDTNTLYKGMRTDSEGHLAIARAHGFTREATGADVAIASDLKGTDVANVPVNGRFIKEAKVASFFLKVDALIGIAHFKGHLLTGFGGALKNIGMGCATREGKLAQHSEVAPIIDIKKCTQCMECAKSCPADAIYLKGHRVFIDGSRCIGCATCIAVCPSESIGVDWEAGGSDVQEKMVEYAAAVLRDKKARFGFINFALKISKDCDCFPKDDPRICPDIGIFASHDPVGIDTACRDAVLEECGKDIFRVVHPLRDGTIQLRRAAELGLGNPAYELIKV